MLLNARQWEHVRAPSTCFIFINKEVVIRFIIWVSNSCAISCVLNFFEFLPKMAICKSTTALNTPNGAPNLSLGLSLSLSLVFVIKHKLF